MGQCPKTTKNTIQNFVSGAISANVHDKLFIRHLTGLPNDKEILLTDLSFKGKKKLRPKFFFF